MLGCADNSRTAADSGSDAGALRAGGIELSGIVEGPAPGGSPIDSVRIEGAEVCQDGVPGCVTTDRYGWFALGGIMPNTEIVLVYRKDGFVSSLQPVVAPSWSSEIGISGMYPRDHLRALDEQGNAVLRAAGRPERDLSDEALASRARIQFGAGFGFAGDEGLTDQVRVALDPGSGDEPFFLLATGAVVLEVPKGETAIAGEYANVEPRDDGYELVYQYAHGECRQKSYQHGGWPSASGRPNATRVPARAGYVTWVTVEECKPAAAE
jgi:hypothetical protein